MASRDLQLATTTHNCGASGFPSDLTTACDDRAKMGLLDLPNELLVKILRYALIASQPVLAVRRPNQDGSNRHQVDSKGNKSSAHTGRPFTQVDHDLQPAILASCSALNLLGTPILYSENTLCLSLSCINEQSTGFFSAQIGETKAKLVNDVQIKFVTRPPTTAQNYTYVKTLDRKLNCILNTESKAVWVEKAVKAFPNMRMLTFETGLLGRPANDGSVARASELLHLNRWTKPMIVETSKGSRLKEITFRARTDGETVILHLPIGQATAVPYAEVVARRGV